MIQRDYRQEAIDAESQRQDMLNTQEAKRRHELDLAKLKLQIKPRNDTWQTLFKAPTFPLVILCMTILTLAGKPIPSALDNFLAK